MLGKSEPHIFSLKWWLNGDESHGRKYKITFNKSKILDCVKIEKQEKWWGILNELYTVLDKSISNFDKWHFDKVSGYQEMQMNTMNKKPSHLSSVKQNPRPSFSKLHLKSDCHQQTNGVSEIIGLQIFWCICQVKFTFYQLPNYSQVFFLVIPDLGRQTPNTTLR